MERQRIEKREKIKGMMTSRMMDYEISDEGIEYLHIKHVDEDIIPLQDLLKQIEVLRGRAS